MVKDLDFLMDSHLVIRSDFLRHLETVKGFRWATRMDFLRHLDSKKVILKATLKVTQMVITKPTLLKDLLMETRTVIRLDFRLHSG